MRTSHTLVLFVLAVAASTAALQGFLRGGDAPPQRAFPAPPRAPYAASGGNPMPSPLPPAYGAPSPLPLSGPPVAAGLPPAAAAFPVGRSGNPPYGTAPPGPDPRTQVERQDFGVPPTGELHAGAMHDPTPASIPGGQVVTTPGLIALLGDRSLGARVFDVLGGPETLPGALAAVPASQPGSFQDATQQQLGQFLQQATQGRRDLPLVFYCASSHCWMSYNAALRAIRLGYTNVLWYRGGLEAWQAAGQPTQRSPQMPGAPGAAVPAASLRDGWSG
jgi:PQQ-dependent catabolism-associated CXXCW motif protein